MNQTLKDEQRRKDSQKEFMAVLSVLCGKFDVENGKFPQHELEGEAFYKFVQNQLDNNL